MITFQRHPDSYRHWRLDVAPPIATLTLQVDPQGGLHEGYELKLNSYDLGVDIELADAVRRLRFEHPEVRCVVITGGLGNVFCAGANIGMLARADHGLKVNFCKFTNETRLEIEDASAASGQRYLAALNGAASGGGYELALACDHIMLVDDRSSTVSLPEVPLLGVLPGTGGLTRLTDKRGVRRDRADVFATRAEGVGGAEAVEWGLVDEVVAPSGWDEAVRDRALALAGPEPDVVREPIVLEPLGDARRFVTCDVDPDRRVAALTVAASADPDWPLRAARELDDQLCSLRFGHPEVATVLVRTAGDPAAVPDPSDMAPEVAGLWVRTLRRLDLTARSLIAAIEPGSCFRGLLMELALAADRSYMLDGIFEDDDDPAPEATIVLTGANMGSVPMYNGLTRLQSRFWGDERAVEAVADRLGEPLAATDAAALGLVTFTPDDLDWDDELRLAVEERASFSPDALTAMEANHRFAGPETMATKIFGRLSAWQNWIFQRPNAAGPDGALRRYGTGRRPDYDPRRT